jgi:MFS family permease
VDFFWRAALKTCTTGLVAGTLYFIVLGALTFFGGVITSSVPPALWFVLFVGTGAIVGLVLGLLVAVAMTLVLPSVNRRGGDQVKRLRWVGAAAAGVPVLLATMGILVFGGLGLLSADVTSVVLVPTFVAAAGGAATAPTLCSRYHPKRPEM